MIINDSNNGVRIDDHDRMRFMQWGKKQYGWAEQTARQYESVFDKFAEWVMQTNPEWLQVTQVQEVRLNDDALRDIEVVTVKEQNATIRRVVLVCGGIIGGWLAVPAIIQAFIH